MTLIDPSASIDRALSIGRWRASGLCLDFVDWAMGRPGSRLGDNGGPPNGAWTEAKDGYYFSNYKHEGDMYPPPGVPCYWETGPSGNTAGHIVISLGDGWCRTTDYAGAASVSTQTIESITRARRGGYLGWTEDYGGNPIAGIQSLEATPAPESIPEPTPGRPIRRRVPMFLIWFTSGVGAVVGITGKRKGLGPDEFDLMKRALYGRQSGGKTFDFEPDTFTDAEAETISRITAEVNA
ncbi:hypothetical protein [Herbiconiux flava]|uniref:CHAP domain-containing protein n=1 Tax=Herbiconiux flava TaxID=881268 RepID=A0A852STN4_9MICO|nr:hypothetical protein [Herbiconiux flava]NYD72289.1 hypothetical protein [Herbiconiux flava]GLK17748.1 hypothetical protein GCM10017602_22300 [Herbiconiux flava]